jgi:hypothetical protein
MTRSQRCTPDLFRLLAVLLPFVGCDSPPAPPAPADRPAAAEDNVLRDPETGATYLLNPQRRVMQPALPPDTQALSLGFSYSMFDWSGTVETRVWECVEYTRRSIQTGIACQVDPDYVLVGGGAWAHYFGAGALLTENRPFDRGLVTWVASSKDHLSADPHELHVYAIGLKLAGVSRAVLLSNMTFVSSGPSAQAAHPAHQVAVPSGYVLTAGGARVNWSGAGNLLTSTRSPYSCCPFTTWTVASKDHVKSSPATIEAYAIGIKPTIAGFGTLETSDRGTAPSRAPCGYSVVRTVNVRPDGWVYTGIGGDTTWNAAGRLLFQVGPDPSDPNQTIVASKDHRAADWGCITSNLITMRKKP